MNQIIFTESKFSDFEVKRRDNVLYATMIQSHSLNSITEQWLVELDAILTVVEQDMTVKALVIRGSGRAFSVGLDQYLLDKAFGDPAYFESVLQRLGSLLLRIEELTAPVVAAVNGLARAGGFELILCCDVVIVSASAKVGDAHTAFGVVPGGGSSFRLPRIVGTSRAKEIFMSGRWMSATELVELGIALQAVPDASLDESVEECLGWLTDKSRGCLGTVKRQMLMTSAAPSAQAIEIEREIFLNYVTPADSDAQEGFRSWREDRQPRWATRVSEEVITS
jgi:enoyl-CoA hydratase/carnithine racemase